MLRSYTSGKPSNAEWLKNSLNILNKNSIDFYKYNYSDLLWHTNMIGSNVKKDQREKEDSSLSSPIHPFYWWGSWSPKEKKDPPKSHRYKNPFIQGERHTYSHTGGYVFLFHSLTPWFSKRGLQSAAQSCKFPGPTPKPAESETLKWVQESLLY